jgi:hypothetical protein
VPRKSTTTISRPGPGYACSPLRSQVLDIIDELLSDPAPAHPEAQERLRAHLEKNPEQPERALLLHLMSRPGEVCE